MKITNHFRAIFAIAMMLCVAFPSLAHDFEVGGIYYNYLDKTAKTVEVTYRGSSVSEYNEYTGSVIIPSSVTYNGTTYSVTSIVKYAFAGCTGLTSVTIPNSVTSIGSSAFYGCTGLTSVTIGNSVISIGDYAFCSCSGLTSVTIGNSVTSIGDYAFSYCRGLTEVTIPNSVTSIGGYAFSECTGLTEVTIPNSVTEIGSSAFKNTAWYNNQADGVVYINNVLYKYKGTMPEGTSISIKDGTVSISPSAFSECTSLTSVTIPNSVTSIGSNTFYKCTGLTSVTIPNSVSSIGSAAFYGCTGLTSVTIPNSVTSIGSAAFYGCTGLTSVTIPNSVTKIDYYVFDSCTGLTEVTIPNSVTSIGERAFSGCTGLTSITIPNSVTSIVKYAFAGCTGLTSVTIPNSVTEIGDEAFYGCTGLTEVNISDLSAWCKIVFDDYYANPLYYANKLKLNGSEIKDLAIPNDITEIKNYAFYSCDGLTSITIGNSVTSIGEYAFRDCDGLTSVTIPNSVTSIGSDAFSGCSGLTSIIIGNSVTEIGDYAFRYCSKLKKVINLSNLTFSKGSEDYGYVASYANQVINNPNGYIEGDFVYSKTDDASILVAYLGNANELILPTVVNGENYEIGDYAFSYCTGLTSITIPNSVTSIGLEAFYGCSNLKNIISLNENPPTCENNSFDSENYANSILYIPKDSYAKYFINDVWGQFNNIVKLENLVSNISINSSSISLESGKTTTLSATVLPSSATFPNLYWESNNENVATVDQTGKVTAHSKGEAIITAKSMDGSNITASCVVKVFTYDVESITLSQHDATLAIKDKVTLKYTITPSYVTDNSVTWSNSNPSVASMAKNSDGSVTISCQEEGETIIKVTTNDGTNLSDSCKIIVYRIPPTITLSKTSENLLIHNTVNLKYTITNSTINTATWTTSDATVASITSNTDGLVTVFAEAEGVATITATMIDVNGKEFSATCEITVIPPTIVLSQTVANLPVNELLTLNYDITNSSIKNATWTTSNPDVAPIKVNSDGSVIVVGLSEGEAIITATMTEVNGVEYSASCKVTVGIGGVEGIETDNNSKEVVRYDIHGRLLSEPTKGINIIKMSDGSTRKEIVK